MDKDITLEEQLKSEQRICSRCKFIVVSPFVELCPRCNLSLPRIEVNCQGCTHNFLCPIVKNRKFKLHSPV